MKTRTGRDGAAGNSVRARKLARANRRLRMPTRLATRVEGLSYQEIGALLRDLRLEQGVAARALEFIVLTACRVSEAGQAEWSALDFEARVWTISAERSKSGQAHRIHLSDEAIAILEQVRQCDPTRVFPDLGSERTGYKALRRVLERIGHPTFAMRASRMTFWIWAAERPQHSRPAVALCLGHSRERSETRAAIRCADLFEGARLLMADWGQWCTDRLSAKGSQNTEIA